MLELWVDLLFSINTFCFKSFDLISCGEDQMGDWLEAITFSIPSNQLIVCKRVS